MKRLLIIISVLSIVFSSYGQYYEKESNKTVKNLPTVTSMEKQKPKTTPKKTTATAQPKKDATNKAVSEETEELYLPETVIIHDTVYAVGNNEDYFDLLGVVKNMLDNSFIEMKLSNFSGSRYTVGVLRNQGYIFLAPLPYVFEGQKSYSNSKVCYDDLDNVEYRKLGQANFKRMDKSFVTENFDPDFLSVTMPESFTNGGVRMEIPSGRINGLMVWFVKNSNDALVDMEVEPIDVMFNAAKSYDIVQPESENVIAGAFLGISTDIPGNLQITLYAMAQKNHNLWELVKVMKDSNEPAAPTSVSSEPKSTPSSSSSRSGGERGGERGSERGGESGGGER